MATLRVSTRQSMTIAAFGRGTRAGAGGLPVSSLACRESAASETGRTAIGTVRPRSFLDGAIDRSCLMRPQSSASLSLSSLELSFSEEDERMSGWSSSESILSSLLTAACATRFTYCRPPSHRLSWLHRVVNATFCREAWRNSGLRYSDGSSRK